MKLPWSRSCTPDSPYAPSGGFTLFEMLIAMALTAVIGAVLFRTWDMVALSGRQAQQAVAGRERDRIVFGIIDNDIAALRIASSGATSLPPLGKTAILSSQDYYKETGTEIPEPEEGESILLSFATGVSALPEVVSTTNDMFCVEYRLRPSPASASKKMIVRRERAFCGISGDFPWREIVLFPALVTARFDLVLPGGQLATEWVDDGSDSADAIGLRLAYKMTETADEEYFYSYIMARRTEIGWE